MLQKWSVRQLPRFGLGQFTRAQYEHAYLLAKGRTGPHPVAAPSKSKAARGDDKIVSTYSAEEALVLDPFCGSGTTLLAARAAGRRTVGIEIEEKFCEIAAIRLSQQIMHFARPIADYRQTED